jgi:hypothetical protein
MVLCDQIERHPVEQGVYNLRGVRTGVRAAAFPFTLPQLWVYLQVSGHEGTASGQLVVLSEATGEEIGYRPIDDIQLLGPLTTVHVQLQILDCEFPAPGVYWFQVILNQKLVAERRFHVVEIPESTNGQSTG